MEIPLSFEHSGDNPDNPQEVINMMVEVDNAGGQSAYTLIGTPGLLEYKETSDPRENRGGFLLSDKSLLTVINNTLYKINYAGVQTTIGTLASTSGTVLFTENPTQVMLVDGGTSGYVYTKATSALAKIVSDITLDSVTFQDSYGLATNNATGRLYHSAVNDFTSWGTLDYVTAESLPDPLVGCFSNHNEIWAFGEQGTDVYYISASSASVTVKRQGAFVEVGAASQFSIALGDTSLFWLDDSGLVRMTSGYTPVIVSTRKLESDISLLDWTTAKGYTYVQSGHTFYVLIVGDVTWVYDLSSKKWAKREGLDKPWAAAWVHQYKNLVLAGDKTNGKIYELSPTTYTDDGSFLRWTATTGIVHNDRKQIAHRIVELYMKKGLGAGKVMMSYSDDGGESWSNEVIKEYKTGEYKERLRWKRLGRSRSRIYKFRGESALERKLISANLLGDVLGN